MFSQQEWQQKAAALRPVCQAIIDGNNYDAQSGQTFPVINPATSQVTGEVPACGEEDIDVAVNSARRSFTHGSWAGLPPRERKTVLLRLSQLVNQHAQELALYDSISMGKPIADALSIDVPGAAQTLAWYAETLDKRYDEIAPCAADRLATITREPVGVVAAVIPWNFPLDIAVWKIAPALAAGNSVVLKPSELSPFSALRLAELALEAGIPPGVLNVVTGTGAQAGTALGLHPDVDVLTFTGSTSVGKAFLAYSARSNLKPVWLECGGKSANIIFADVQDLDLAAENAALGFCYNQGEVCSAFSRLLVERSIYHDFISLLKEKMRAWQPAHPLCPSTTIGPQVSAEHKRKVMAYINAAVNGGAMLLTGGAEVNVDGISNYVQPALLAVETEMAIWKEEIFGPVAAIRPFDSEQEAVELANRSIYALAASVWTDDLSRAHRVARQLNAGTVSVNTVDVIDVTVPFGGNKQSGYGRDLSLHAYEKFTNLKTTWFQLKAADPR